jgi:cytochrome c oxidase cbb3-type subunit 2
MPGYPFLAQKDLTATEFYKDASAHLQTLQMVGVPYTQAEIDNAAADLEAQATPGAETKGLFDRYKTIPAGGTDKDAVVKVNARDFDGQPDKITELDALIAYLQELGTLVDFSTFKTEAESR